MANQHLNKGIKIKQQKINISNPVLNRNKYDSVFNVDEKINSDLSREIGYEMQDQEYQDFTLIQDSVTRIGNITNSNLSN